MAAVTKGPHVSAAAFQLGLRSAANTVKQWLALLAIVWARVRVWLPFHLPLRFVGNTVLQLLLALLPSVPVRIKGISVTFEASILAFIKLVPYRSYLAFVP